MISSKHSEYFGPVMMFLAAVLFSLGGVLAKMVPWSALAINGSRGLLAAIVMGIYLLATHHPPKLNRITLFGAVGYAGTTTLFMLANKMTTAANAIILQYTAPVWIILLMALFFHQKPQKLDLITIAVVLVGIACFFFDSLGGGSVSGDLIAVASGAFYAVLFILNTFKDGDLFSSVFYGALLSAICFGPLALRETDYSAAAITGIVLLGVVQVGVAYIFFGLGTKYTHPVTACLINGTEPILNPLWVALFVGETLSPLSLVGAAIVIGGILAYNVIKAKKQNT